MPTVLFLLFIIYEVFKLNNWRKYYTISRIFALTKHAESMSERQILYKREMGSYAMPIMIADNMYIIFCITLLFTSYWYTGLAITILSLATSEVTAGLHKHADVNTVTRRYRTILTIDAILSIIILSLPIMYINGFL